MPSWLKRCRQQGDPRTGGARSGSGSRRARQDLCKEHGKKVSQTKALLACLARNPAPAALQVVLGVSNRTKQKSVQAYAGDLVDDAADRRGWSPDELADRTIPSAGLDENGELGLDCGEDRQFKAVYLGDGKLNLLNPQGKPVKALPGPRGDEEKEVVAAAKKQLASARKEIKQTETAQQERLYEALCIGRVWPLELWQSYLVRHPDRLSAGSAIGVAGCRLTMMSAPLNRLT